MVQIRNRSPLGDINVELLRPYLGSTLVEAGAVIDVPDHVAGTVPGTWRAPTDLELTAPGGLAGLVTRGGGDGPLEVLCPGTGLLAQVANFEPVTPPKGSSKTTDAGAPADTVKEG